MKQKLALSCALIHRPKVLFLDEPTTGVDAVSRDEFWEMLGRLQEYGITILVSTPYMDEAARCERIALIQQGEIMKVDSPEGIRAAYQKPLFALRSKEPYRLMQDLRRATFIESVEPFGEYLHVATRSVEAKELILPFLRKRDHQEIEMKSIRPTIEDVFLDLIQ
jgi:ABC-type multidrug transport system ATPase subunit